MIITITGQRASGWKVPCLRDRLPGPRRRRRPRARRRQRRRQSDPRLPNGQPADAEPRRHELHAGCAGKPADTQPLPLEVAGGRRGHHSDAPAEAAAGGGRGTGGGRGGDKSEGASQAAAARGERPVLRADEGRHGRADRGLQAAPHCNFTVADKVWVAVTPVSDTLLAVKRTSS